MVNSNRPPVLFIGHGSPMNAIQKNDFTQALQQIGSQIPQPKAILCISAHWLSAGTWVSRMPQPPTIHDFYGFPKELYQVQYPAPGDIDLADEIRKQILSPHIHADERSWGLDHGTWSVLKHMYPQANIPVLQLSIDMSEPASYHFELGKQLRFLRTQGVLILGSGNIVHNLGNFSPDRSSRFDWAIEFDEWVKKNLLKKDFNPLIQDFNKTTAGRLSVPTPDHYLPLLYVLGAADDKDSLRFEYEGVEHGSISMRCLSLRS